MRKAAMLVSLQFAQHLQEVGLKEGGEVCVVHCCADN